MSRQRKTGLMPYIIVGVDCEKDIEQFNYFLNSKEYSGMREKILNFYPKLSERINQGEPENKATHKVVSDMYRRYEMKIKEIAKTAEKEFSESELVFTALAKYMDFPKLSERSYSAVPTFLPFSPLGDNIFFFSITSAIAGQEMKPFQIVTIGVHEISHFIFSEQLNEWQKNNGIELNDPSVHYFKEALTAVIMDQPEFKKFFNFTSYPGNLELHELSIIEKDRKVEGLVKFFEKEIIFNPDGYTTGLDKILRRFKGIENIFAKKWKLWNGGLENDKELKEEYRKPIEIL